MTNNKQSAIFNDTSRYHDIMDQPRHRSSAHLPMPREERAAQFSPFAALTGYHQLLARIADKYQHKTYLTVAVLRHLTAQLALLEREKPLPAIKVEYFNDQSGFYENYTGRIKKINHATHKIIFTDQTEIAVHNLRKIKRIKD